MKEKKLFLGEIALIMGLICNSLASTLMVKSEFGISAISSVPYTLSLTFIKRFAGIGVGTVACAFITGNVVAYVGNIIDSSFYFDSYIGKIKNKNSSVENANYIEYEIK